MDPELRPHVFHMYPKLLPKRTFDPTRAHRDTKLHNDLALNSARAFIVFWARLVAPVWRGVLQFEFYLAFVQHLRVPIGMPWKPVVSVV